MKILDDGIFFRENRMNALEKILSKNKHHTQYNKIVKSKFNIFSENEIETTSDYRVDDR